MDLKRFRVAICLHLSDNSNSFHSSFRTLIHSAVAVPEEICISAWSDAAMSALFGQVKGAFTGALKDRPGLLRAADNGVLFLDEIGELGLDEQAMLLRAREDKTFMPLGGDREVRSDFQLIAGTNCDLVARVRERLLHEDLLARINPIGFQVAGTARTCGRCRAESGLRTGAVHEKIRNRHHFQS
jgi:sigma54-dependent transcription regulator